MNRQTPPAATRFTISQDESGQRIDNFLHNKLKGVPKSLIYRLLRKGALRVNGKRIKAEYKLQPGDELRLPALHTAPADSPPVSPHLRQIAALQQAIIYEDDHLLVINKPSGMAVHGGSGLHFGLIEALRALRPQARFLDLVHRLDRDTSGLLLIAKKRAVLRVLHEQLRNKQMCKEYLALVRGQWPASLKNVRVPLLKNILQSGERHVIVSENGKPSETRFKIEARYPHATLLRCRLITGRTHQIRVHTRHAGHPIAFDPRYGDPEFDQQLAFTGVKRLFLHASTLTFTHPVTGDTLALTAPMDNTLKIAIGKLHQQHAVMSHQ